MGVWGGCGYAHVVWCVSRRYFYKSNNASRDRNTKLLKQTKKFWHSNVGSNNFFFRFWNGGSNSTLLVTIFRLIIFLEDFHTLVGELNYNESGIWNQDWAKNLDKILWKYFLLQFTPKNFNWNIWPCHRETLWHGREQQDVIWIIGGVGWGSKWKERGDSLKLIGKIG